MYTAVALLDVRAPGVADMSKTIQFVVDELTTTSGLPNA